MQANQFLILERQGQNAKVEDVEADIKASQERLRQEEANLRASQERLRQEKVILDYLDGLIARAEANPEVNSSDSASTSDRQSSTSLSNQRKVPLSILAEEILKELPEQRGYLDDIIQGAEQRGYEINRASLQAMLSRDQKNTFVPVASGTGQWALKKEGEEWADRPLSSLYDDEDVDEDEESEEDVEEDAIHIF